MKPIGNSTSLGGVLPKLDKAIGNATNQTVGENGNTTINAAELANQLAHINLSTFIESQEARVSRSGAR
jgi:hypothetical protein